RTAGRSIRAFEGSPGKSGAGILTAVRTVLAGADPQFASTSVWMACRDASPRSRKRTPIPKWGMEWTTSACTTTVSPVGRGKRSSRREPVGSPFIESMKAPVTLRSLIRGSSGVLPVLEHSTSDRYAIRFAPRFSTSPMVVAPRAGASGASRPLEGGRRHVADEYKVRRDRPPRRWGIILAGSGASCEDRHSRAEDGGGRPCHRHPR